MTKKSYSSLLIVVVLAVTGWILVEQWQDPGEASVVVAPGSSVLPMETKAENIIYDERIKRINEQLLALQSQQTQLIERMSGMVDAANKLGKKLDTVLAANDKGELQEEKKLINDVLLPTEQAYAESVISSFNDILSDEDIDSAWSVSAESQISDVFSADVLSGSELINAECGSNLCRTEIRHNGNGLQDVENFQIHFGTRLGWDFDSYTEVINDPDGTIRTIMYISRDKHMLPGF